MTKPAAASICPQAPVISLLLLQLSLRSLQLCDFSWLCSDDDSVKESIDLLKQSLGCPHKFKSDEQKCCKEIAFYLMLETVGKILGEQH